MSDKKVRFTVDTTSPKIERCYTCKHKNIKPFIREINNCGLCNKTTCRTCITPLQFDSFLSLNICRYCIIHLAYYILLKLTFYMDSIKCKNCKKSLYINSKLKTSFCCKHCGKSVCLFCIKNLTNSKTLQNTFEKSAQKHEKEIFKNPIDICKICFKKICLLVFLELFVIKLKSSTFSHGDLRAPFARF